MDWSGVDYLWIIVMFLSAVWTLILTAPIHCRGSIGERVIACKWQDANFLQICSNEETNWSTSWMAWGWVHFQFRVNYSFYTEISWLLIADFDIDKFEHNWDIVEISSDLIEETHVRLLLEEKILNSRCLHLFFI